MRLNVVYSIVELLHVYEQCVHARVPLSCAYLVLLYVLVL